jgi:hypothetical protein
MPNLTGSLEERGPSRSRVRRHRANSEKIRISDEGLCRRVHASQVRCYRKTSDSDPVRVITDQHYLLPGRA